MNQHYYMSVCILFALALSSTLASFTPGTIIQPYTVEFESGDIGTVVAQFSLLNGANYSSDVVPKESYFSNFISSADELLFLLTGVYDTDDYSLLIYDYSSSVPTLKSSCSIPFIPFYGCVVYSNGDIYIATTYGKLYIISTTCQYKEILSIPPNGAGEVSTCAIDIAANTLFYANQTNIVKIVLTDRDITMFELPSQDQEDYQYEFYYGQNAKELYFLLNFNATKRILYTVDTSNGALQEICNDSNCHPALNIDTIIGIDDRYSNTSLGTLFVCLDGFTPLFIDLSQTVQYNASALSPFWQSYASVSWSHGNYDPYGEIL